MSEKHRIEIYAVEHETEKAICVQVKIPGSVLHESMWFPLSHVHEICRNANPPYIVVSQWIAKQKGFL